MARGPRVVQFPTIWSGLLRRDARGKVYPDLANVLIALRAEPQLADAMAFNEMLQRTIVMTEWPSAPGALAGEKPPHELTPDDVSRLQEWLQHNGLPRIARDNVGQAIEVFARERRFHPLRDWFEAQQWDGDARAGTWLSVCLGCPDDDYHAQIGAMALIAMVARVFEPGCKSDYLLVLEGPQGEEKSKFCRALAGGDEYFSDHLPPIDGDPVRLAMHLRGKFIIEVAELAAMLKAEPETAKHFFSRQIEKYVGKYQREEVSEPRQCFFIGTTNDDEYIRDTTGGRRFWPVKTVKVNVAALIAMRAQLFAEAVQLYRDKLPWWPEREFEKAVIAPVQDARQWEDAWTDQVRDHTQGKPSITIAHLAQLIGIEHARLDMLAQKRLAAILRKQNWKRYRAHGNVMAWAPQ